MGAITYREGGAIPEKQLATLAAALGLLADQLPDAEQLRASARVVSAWEAARLVGLGRLLGDGRTLLVLQAVVVDPAYRHHGIGSELVRRCLTGWGDASVLVLLAEPGEAAFYAPFGFTQPVQALLRPASAE